MKISNITKYAKKTGKLKRTNPVAKHAGQFNSSKVFRDRTKYSRKDKFDI